MQGRSRSSPRPSGRCGRSGLRKRAAVPDAGAQRRPARPPARQRALLLPAGQGDALLLLLDAQDIACSTGSACSAGIAQLRRMSWSRWVPTLPRRPQFDAAAYLRRYLDSLDDELVAVALPAAVERACRAGAVKTRDPSSRPAATRRSARVLAAVGWAARPAVAAARRRRRCTTSPGSISRCPETRRR